MNIKGNNTALPNIYPEITLNPKPIHSKKIVFQVSNNTMADLTNKPRATPQVKFSGRGGTGRFSSLYLELELGVLSPYPPAAEGAFSLGKRYR